MASPELTELWKTIRADLRRARGTLPPEADTHNAVRQCHEFLDHNELELACDMLEAYAEDHPVPREFWLALRDASAKMQLRDRAARYDARAAPTAQRHSRKPTPHGPPVDTEVVPMPQPPGEGWTRSRYFAFWDVPSGLVIHDQARTLLLMREFDEDLDDYPSDYEVWELEPIGPDQALAAAWPEISQRKRRQLDPLPGTAFEFWPRRERDEGRSYVWYRLKTELPCGTATRDRKA